MAEKKLSNWRVEVAKADKPNKVAGICAKRKGALKKKTTFECKPPIVGRYITLKQDGVKKLYFSEMIVSGEPIGDNPTPDGGDGK